LHLAIYHADNAGCGIVAVKKATVPQAKTGWHKRCLKLGFEVKIRATHIITTLTRTGTTGIATTIAIIGVVGSSLSRGE
jgi:hypothetical protein